MWSRLDQLIPQLYDEKNWHVRRNAADELKSYPRGLVITHLVRCLGDPDAHVVEAVQRVLIGTDKERLAIAIRDCLNSFPEVSIAFSGVIHTIKVEVIG